MGQRIGFARFSTDEQNLDLQVDELHKVGIFDAAAGAINQGAIERSELSGHPITSRCGVPRTTIYKHFGAAAEKQPDADLN